MKVVLELQDQPSNVRRITVRHDIVIGRGSDCNLRLSAPQVSRRHCFLRVGRDSVSVTDLDSSNGTFIDGTRITSGKRHDIANGAQLALGPIRFTIHVRSDVPVAETANSSSTPEPKRSKSSRDAVPAYAAGDSSTANAQMRPDDAKAQMDYAVEQAGESAEPNEPTADYLEEQFSANGSANLFSNAPDPADSRLGIADFGKRHAEHSDVNQETNDCPDSDIAGKSATVHEVPRWDSNVVDSLSSPENVEAVTVAEDVESVWLSVDDDDTLLPEPMNLGNAYVGETSHDAFNDAHAEVVEEVEEIEEVMEVHDFEDVSEVAEAAELIDAETNLAELEEIVEVHDSIEIEDAGQAEQELHHGEVQDWLNFDEAVEVQETLDVEVEDAFDEVVISETDNGLNPEPVAELHSIDDAEVVAVIEEVSVEAEDMQVEDWRNFNDVVEVQEIPDVEDVVEVEHTLEEAVIGEIEDGLHVEPAAELQSIDDAVEVAVIQEVSGDAEDMQVEDWLNFEDAVEVQENSGVEEVIEVEDALDEVVISGTEDRFSVEPVAELQSIDDA